ncbi:MAG: pirin family protein [Planctomycetes bacterium]|nr:pirin family protein [Planctomycetota bacterium]
MIGIRRSDDRGRSQHSWLDRRLTFSFADYQDPRHMGYGALRVLNEDRIGPGAGFPSHAHNDLEILSYVIEGGLQHRDSLGNEMILHPGEVQWFGAGRGVTHSEYNASSTDEVHFLQIYILPEREGLEPGCAVKTFPVAGRRGELRRIASRDGSEGSLPIRQEIDVYASILAPGERISRPCDPRHHHWLQLVAGSVRVNGRVVQAGDGAAVAEESALVIESIDPAEFLLFDLR